MEEECSAINNQPTLFNLRASNRGRLNVPTCCKMIKHKF